MSIACKEKERNKNKEKKLKDEEEKKILACESFNYFDVYLWSRLTILFEHNFLFITMMTTLADEYSARAMAIRFFCPPDKLIPFVPISVRSPSGKH